MHRHAARRPVALAVAVLLGLGAFATPLAAVAEDDPQAPLEEMTEFLPEDFVAEAAELPLDLVEALESDVELTPEEFLAQGAAAAQAVEVVDSLETSGVDVLGSRMEGTELVVNVPTEADAATVESTGATAELGEPAPGWDASGFTPEFAADLYGGQGWVWDDGTYIYQCSVGFTGRLVSSGANQFATAGHCTDEMSAPASIWNQSVPGQAGSRGATIGSVVAGATHFNIGDDADVGRVSSGNVTQKPSTLTWGGSSGAPLSSTPVALSGYAAPIVGSTLCKSGSRTGWACGAIVDVDDLVDVGGVDVLSVVAKLCVLPGDSGGAGIVGKRAVGITSWTTTPSACNYNYSPPGVYPPTGSYAGFFQMVSPAGGVSVTSLYTDWEMIAAVSAPTITSISTSGGNATAINGKVANAGRNYKVDIYLDGSSSVFTTVTVNASSGNWSANVSSVSAGLHSFTAVARFGKWSKSSATAGSFSRGVTVDRIAGSDRFKTAAAVAAKFATADTVYIANGLNYPDALSAAPAAGSQDAPLLLTMPTDLPAATAAQLTRLQPDTVYIAGGTGVVSSTVRNQIKALLPDATITRLAGADRYSTSRLISETAFPTSARAYVATGTNFPDALSAAAAAGDRSAPVVLVYGPSPTLDAATKAVLQGMDVSKVYIAGGTGVVSSGIASGIDALAGVSVQRLAGDNRYATSVAINKNAFSSATDAYLAVGTGFADALAGAALAGSTSSPLFVVEGSCVPAAALSAMASMGVQRIHLLGGTGVLDNNVAALKQC